MPVRGYPDHDFSNFRTTFSTTC